MGTLFIALFTIAILLIAFDSNVEKEALREIELQSKKNKFVAKEYFRIGDKFYKAKSRQTENAILQGNLSREDYKRMVEYGIVEEV